MDIFLSMKNKSLDHALHNETVCLFLDKPKDKHDWVVTTAFYSAMHYARHKIFPLEMETTPNKIKKFDCFDDYYMWYKFVNGDKGRHEAMKRLVRREMAGIAENYEHLLGMAHSARYDDYNLDKMSAKCAKDNLEFIKKACNF
jgi:hypothetical protein